MEISIDSTSRVAQFGSEQSLTNSGSSISYFSVDETQLDFLGREGVEFEDAACFSFEQVDTLVRNQERVLSYTEKVKLWQYACEIKKQRSKWVQSSLLSSEELDQLYGLGGRLESAWCEVVLDEPLPAEASMDCQSTPRTWPVGDADTPAPWRHLQPPSAVPGRGSFWKRVRQGFAPKRPPTREQIFLRRVMSVPSLSPLVRNSLICIEPHSLFYS
ncbi:hypothetical protein ISCGN_026716 [Ixodes scapularis]